MLVLRAGLKSSYGSLFLIGVFMSRARTQTLTLTTLRGLKIYLLFNRLVRRYVMSVNVNVNVNVRVGK